MISRRNRRRHATEAKLLNITPLLNLMVILIPFLLINVSFTRMAVLQINVPSSSAQPQEPTNELHLEVVVRDDHLVVGDGHRQIATIGKTKDGKYNYAALSAVIQRIKHHNPKAKHARVLLEPDTPYYVLIHVMDTLRMVRKPNPNRPGKIQISLFPDIALGDAP